MWEAEPEPLIVLEVSSGVEEEEDWVFDHDTYGYGNEFSKDWSAKEDPEEEPEEASPKRPRFWGEGSDMEEANSDLRSDLGGQ